MQKTLVTFLLDRTGSMERIKNDTIGGFNAYLEGLTEGAAADDTEFTFVQFDSVSIDKVCVSKPVKEVDKLTDATYSPRAWTPLIDASYKTIKAVETAVAGSDKKVVITIQTDGEENASTEHSWQDLNDLIKEKTKLGWQFNFLGVGIDAYNQGAKMGIATANTMSATLDPQQMRAAYRFSGGNAAVFASGLAGSTSYSKAQKLSAGDAHDDADPVFPVPPTATVGMPPRKKTGTTPKVKSRPIVDDLDLTK